MQDLEQSASLHPFCELGILDKDSPRSVVRMNGGLNSARQDGGPGSGGECVVEDEVARLERAGRGFRLGLFGGLLLRRHGGRLCWIVA